MSTSVLEQQGTRMGDREGERRGGPAPRVLIVSENGSIPADRRVWDISTALARAGCEVVAICPRGAGEGEAAAHELREGVNIHRFRARFAEGGVIGYLREYGSAAWQIYRLVSRLSRERPFDVVHACNPPDFLLFCAWPARRRGARTVFDHHDLTPELFLTRFGRPRWLYRLTLAVERACYAAADVVLATNESYRRIACARGGKRAEQVFVVRNGPDLRRFRSRPADPALKRGKNLLIAYVGLMAPQDGIDHALRALALLATRRHDWHAIFAGEGDARAELEALAARLGLADRVEFTGWLEGERIAELLCSADLCLAPEPRSPLNEVSTMVKIAEYMAMSRPIVAYGLSESRFTAGEAAVYAEPNEIDDYAACIEQLLDAPARRERMGRLGRERVERELSWERSEHNLARAYRSVLGEKSSMLEGCFQ